MAGVVLIGTGSEEDGADIGAGLLVLVGGLLVTVAVVLGAVWAVLAVHRRRRPA